MSFYKVICGVMVGVLLAIQLKHLGSPVWVYLSVVLSLFVLFYAMERFTFVMDFLDGVLEDICRESGFITVAGQIEIGGKLTMMVMSMPILLAIVNTITSVMP